mgnify:CR=1 FL=1
MHDNIQWPHNVDSEVLAFAHETMMDISLVPGWSTKLYSRSIRIFPMPPKYVTKKAKDAVPKTNDHWFWRCAYK